MSPVQQRLLVLWAALLSAIVCMGFLPVSRLTSVLLLLAIWALIGAVWYIASRRHEYESAVRLDNLPEATYRQPVVLVCGDLPQSWPDDTSVLTVAQGCWVRVDATQDLSQFAEQLLWLRPDWGRQLSVMVTVCPQQHAETETLTSYLLALRWQVSQIRRNTGHSIPLVLNGVVGSAMMSDTLWQAAIPEEGVSVWRESSAPCSIACWVTTGGAMALQQQVLMNNLMTWFHHHVKAVFKDDNSDIPRVLPTAMLWGMGPSLKSALQPSVWTGYLAQRTAMHSVAGLQPVDSEASSMKLLPDFVLPLLPEGQGMTPRQRTLSKGLTIFTLAGVLALGSSGWNNRELIHRLSFDIKRYDRISMDDYSPKANAVNVLREDAAQLDFWARNGEPVRMSLGLYQGERLRMPVLDAIRSYIPRLPPPKPAAKTEPKIIRLDSISLFDSGKSDLKPGSTKVLVNSLVGIKAKPGWLIVVSGHTDNTGTPPLNQTLSLRRAESVRNWMRDTGDVPESCFAVQGYGASRPVATNDTAEGRAANRRVEISLVPQANACQVVGKSPASSQDDDAS
ncbi:OmpA family protein [Scandinavium sp. H11S7]|uniref:OmpA family protein n=1 Tax=Scandinavium hiltneri TaxID=2926519 RepID=A0ABT2E9R9_9ENTR|nr:OmpA family protein [Scandinavium hiltneri]MCS2163737.1 OmpA family protein [Scandinavium hiltneri]